MRVADGRSRPSVGSGSSGIQADGTRASYHCTFGWLAVDSHDVAYDGDYKKIPWLDRGCDLGRGCELGRIGDVPLVLYDVVHIDLENYGSRLAECGTGAHDAQESCNW
jgi:hypothetical protein